ncbi:MAG: hypothetical protein QOF71_2955 [Candidatus Eremiobacteraeota bacterium]|jgi:hypothetical protein|nr:hypothetical protein [Candidatus Eremiobacteraeota bacterium]
MNRRSALCALATSAAACFVPRSALADGLIRFRNVTFPGSILVEVRVGSTLDSATLYGTQKIARGDLWEVDTTGAIAWWRRELAPGANDGRYTAWQRVDPSRSDERVDL